MGAMIALVVVALSVGVVAAAAHVARVRRRQRADMPPCEVMFDPVDRAELEALLASVERDGRGDQGAQLSVGLHDVIARHVPLRTVEANWALRAVRLRFADGTAVLLSGARPGAFGVLASRVRQGSVCLLGCRPDPAGTTLVFDGPRGREILLVGAASLDQPD
jgi:hypothetical protein